MKNLYQVLKSQLQGDLSEEMSDFILTLAIESEDRKGRPCVCCDNSICISIIEKIEKKEVSLKPSRKMLNAFLQKFSMIWSWSIIKHMQQGKRNMFTKESINLIQKELQNNLDNGHINNAKIVASLLFRELTADEIAVAEKKEEERLAKIAEAEKIDLQVKRLESIKAGNLSKALEISEKQRAPLSQEELKEIARVRR